MTEQQINEEYISIITQIVELNKKRLELFEKFQELNPDPEIKIIKTLSFYYDLFGNEIK